jgi:hypothetical protein
MPRGRTKIEVTLFPFLSVLVCTMGVLALIIIAASLCTTAMQPAPEPAPKPEPLKEEKPDPVKILEKEKTDLQEKVQISEKELKDTLEWLRKVTSLEGAVPELEAQTEEGKKVRATLEEELKQLLVQINKAAEELQKIPPPPPPPKGTKLALPEELTGGYKLNPVFVDCRRDGIVILQDNGKFISKEQIEHSNDVSRLLSNIRTSGNWCLLMLIREGSVDTFYDLYQKVLQARIRYGFHPVLAKGDFDVSNWKRPSWFR